MAHTQYLPELTEKEMLAHLEAERVGRIGLHDEPCPYVVPTDFAYADGSVYIHSPEGGKKTALARRDPRVCFEVDRYSDDVTEYWSILIRGDIEEVRDPDVRREAMRLMAKKAASSGGWKAHPGGTPGMGSIVVFRIGVREMTGVKSPPGGHP